MDYTGLADFTGSMVAEPVALDRVDRAISAYESMGSFYYYPEGYLDWLKTAREKLKQLRPAELTVEVEHNGQGLFITYVAVAA